MKSNDAAELALAQWAGDWTAAKSEVISILQSIIDEAKTAADTDFTTETDSLATIKANSIQAKEDAVTVATDALSNATTGLLKQVQDALAAWDASKLEESLFSDPTAYRTNESNKLAVK